MYDGINNMNKYHAKFVIISNYLMIYAIKVVIGLKQTLFYDIPGK